MVSAQCLLRIFQGSTSPKGLSGDRRYIHLTCRTCTWCSPLHIQCTSIISCLVVQEVNRPPRCGWVQIWQSLKSISASPLVVLLLDSLPFWEFLDTLWTPAEVFLYLELISRLAGWPFSPVSLPSSSCSRLRSEVRAERESRESES